ncbi:MAG: sugar phosphate isomerase/epimerase [Angelakisella sp.]
MSMKTAVSSYSFWKLIQKGEMTQFDCVAKAKELGFDGIEFIDLAPHDGSTQAQYAKKLADESRRVGIAITNYTVGADFLTGSNGDVDAEIARVKQQVDIAVLLGASGMRHDATRGFAPNTGKGFAEALPILADACRQVTEYAATCGIRTMVENHGQFCQDSARVEQLINAVAHPNFGWLCDMGNFLCVDEDPIVACGRAVPYAFNVHAKDFYIKSGNGQNPGIGHFRSRGGNYLKGTIVGHGDVPVLQCLSIFKRSGYDGYVAIEFEGMEDVLTAIDAGLQNLKRYLELA